MTIPEPDNGTTRDDLVQRIELMETMIAEGRRSTTRCGWIFVLWGVVNTAGIAWEWYRPSYWIWPTVLAVGFALTLLGRSWQKTGRGMARCANMQGRSIEAVWMMMGLATSIYVGLAIARGVTWQDTYLAAIFMFVGLAHATSAMILRWRVQGFVAGLWWAGAIAVFFIRSSNDIFIIFPLEMLFGMVLFGLYAMMLDRRDGGLRSQNA